MALILHNDPSPPKGEQGPQYGCCGKLIRDYKPTSEGGPGCGCPKSPDAVALGKKAPEMRSAEALEAIRDTLLAIAERLNLPQHPRKSA